MAFDLELLLHLNIDCRWSFFLPCWQHSTAMLGHHSNHDLCGAGGHFWRPCFRISEASDMGTTLSLDVLQESPTISRLISPTSWAISLENLADQSRFGFRQLIWSVYFSIPEMRTARPAISGNQLASTAKFECRNFSNFRLSHAIFPICSISSNIISFKTILEYILVLLIRKTAALSKCNSVFFSVKIGTVELRKSNILAPEMTYFDVASSQDKR